MEDDKKIIAIWAIVLGLLGAGMFFGYLIAKSPAKPQEKELTLDFCLLSIYNNEKDFAYQTIEVDARGCAGTPEKGIDVYQLKAIKIK